MSAQCWAIVERKGVDKEKRAGKKPARKKTLPTKEEGIGGANEVSHHAAGMAVN